ncbi:MAG: hypothetical protein HDT28_02655 [Clostridiales bacterium]|nr:hypothetical protein [Clostridiales bacterium]
MWWNSMSAFQQAAFIIACAATAVLIVQIILMLVGGSNDADVTGGGGLTDGDIGGGGLTDGDISGGGLTDADVSSGGGSMLDFDVPSGSVTDGSDGMSDGGGDGTDSEVSGGGIAAFGLRLLSLRSIIAFAAVGGWLAYTLCYFMGWYVALPVALVCGFAAACGMAGAIIGMEKMQSSGNLNPQNAVGTIGTVYLTVPPSRSGYGKINILIQERYAEYQAVTDSTEPLPTASEIKVVKHIGANILLVEKYKKPSITIEKN